MKLISFDLKADFGFFRVPDTNNTINLSYNIIHKPAILGILGAVMGLSGYNEKGKLPEYYEKLKDLKIGVEPLDNKNGYDKGNYLKTNIKYSNTVGYANKGSNFLTEELTLINPVYRIYLLIDEESELHKKLFHYLANGETEYIPYFGKNEFTAWWEKESFTEYDFKKAKEDIAESVKIKTVFVKDFVVNENKQNLDFDLIFSEESETPFLYFERLPKDFNLDLMQYHLTDFVYSTFQIKNASRLPDLYYLESKNAYIQLI